MDANALASRITALYHQPPAQYTTEHQELFLIFRSLLEQGTIRAAEFTPQGKVVHTWVKEGILLGFRMSGVASLPAWEGMQFTDKAAWPVQSFDPDKTIRLVPGGSSVRAGAYIAPNVTMMPPMYINCGAYVDSGTMIDSHALVGSCAQVGKRVHLSAGAMLGGVLEPVGAMPVMVGDGAFIGGNCGVYEGITIGEQAVLAPGVILSGSTPIYDAVKKDFIRNGEIPAGAVIVPGSRPMNDGSGMHLYCPVLVKYRDEKTTAALVLSDLFRS